MCTEGYVLAFQRQWDQPVRVYDLAAYNAYSYPPRMPGSRRSWFHGLC